MCTDKLRMVGSIRDDLSRMHEDENHMLSGGIHRVGTWRCLFRSKTFFPSGNLPQRASAGKDTLGSDAPQKDCYPQAV